MTALEKVDCKDYRHIINIRQYKASQTSVTLSHLVSSSVPLEVLSWLLTSNYGLRLYWLPHTRMHCGSASWRMFTLKGEALNTLVCLRFRKTREKDFRTNIETTPLCSCAEFPFKWWYFLAGFKNVQKKHGLSLLIHTAKMSSAHVENKSQKFLKSTWASRD